MKVPGLGLSAVRRTDLEGERAYDDQAFACRDLRRNAEFGDELRVGYPRSKNTQVAVNCTQAENLALNCGDL